MSKLDKIKLGLEAIKIEAGYIEDDNISGKQNIIDTANGLLQILAEPTPQPTPANRDNGDLLTDMRMEVLYTDVVTMPIPLYERMKKALQSQQQEVK